MVDGRNRGCSGERREISAGATAGRWEHFAHDADIGVRGWGPTPAAAFGQAAVALTAVMTDPSLVRTTERLELACEAPDLDLLFPEWLNALVYETATRSMLFSRFDVSITGTRLSAVVWGEPLDRDRHHPAAEVKGATLTALKVECRSDGEWLAQCVVDV